MEFYKENDFEKLIEKVKEFLDEFKDEDLEKKEVYNEVLDYIDGKLEDKISNLNQDFRNFEYRVEDDIQNEENKEIVSKIKDFYDNKFADIGLGANNVTVELYGGSIYVYVPEDKIGLAIGKGGSTVKDLQDKLNRSEWIEIKSDDEIPENLNENKDIAITEQDISEWESIAEALSKINDFGQLYYASNYAQDLLQNLANLIEDAKGIVGDSSEKVEDLEDKVVEDES